METLSTIIKYFEKDGDWVIYLNRPFYPKYLFYINHHDSCHGSNRLLHKCQSFDILGHEIVEIMGQSIYLENKMRETIYLNCLYV